MASVALRGVTKQYTGAGAVVRDLTLDIADGELLVLLGPSGSGKSTVLRMIAGLDDPTAGRLFIGDTEVTHLPPQDRDVAMVFQTYALYPHKTVRDNLAFALRVRGTSRAGIETRVAAVARQLGLEGLLDRKPAQLSGGQRQRVALGRAIIRDAQVYLLDEPLSNLDPVLRTSTRAELALLHQRLGATMVYVTHDQEEAMTLGTRMGVMRDGVLEQVATPLEVFERPATAFIAGFVGSPAMNLWPCMAEQAAGGLRLVTAAWTAALPPSPLPPPVGEPLLVGVRPHHISAGAPGSGLADGRVALVEPLGASTVAHVRLERDPERLVRVQTHGPHGPELGDLVGLAPQRDRWHLFHAATGRRAC